MHNSIPNLSIWPKRLINTFKNAHLFKSTNNLACNFLLNSPTQDKLTKIVSMISGPILTYKTVKSSGPNTKPVLPGMKVWSKMLTAFTKKEINFWIKLTLYWHLIQTPIQILILKHSSEKSRKDTIAKMLKTIKTSKNTFLISNDYNIKIKQKAHNLMKINDNTQEPNFNWIFAWKVIFLLTLDLKEFKKC